MLIRKEAYGIRLTAGEGLEDMYRDMLAVAGTTERKTSKEKKSKETTGHNLHLEGGMIK